MFYRSNAGSQMKPASSHNPRSPGASVRGGPLVHPKTRFQEPRVAPFDTLCVYSLPHAGSTHTCPALHRWQMVSPPPAFAAGRLDGLPVRPLRCLTQRVIVPKPSPPNPDRPRRGEEWRVVFALRRSTVRFQGVRPCDIGSVGVCGFMAAGESWSDIPITRRLLSACSRCQLSVT